MTTYNSFGIIEATERFEMEQIISYLIAIKSAAKAIHYRTYGEKFWGDHLLVDRVADDLDDFIDEIFENYYLGKSEDAPQQKVVMSGASGLIPLVDNDIEKDFGLLDELVVNCLSELQMLAEANQDLTLGDNDLMGRISSDLQKKHGFIWRRIKK